MSFVAFLHTYTGLGKSTFLKKLYDLDKEKYAIIQSDVIKDKYKHLPMGEQNQKARSEFNYHLVNNPKIVLADKNFIKPKDLKYLEKKKNSIILHVEDSFELPTIMLLLYRVINRSNHESLKNLSKEDQVKTLKVTLSFINLSLQAYSNNPKVSNYIPIKFFKNDIKNADLGIGDYTGLLLECIKQASFRNINDNNPIFIQLFNLLISNTVILNEKISNHILSIDELNLEVLRVNEIIKSIHSESSVSYEGKESQKKPIYIGYFVDSDNLNSQIAKYDIANEIVKPHITMAYSENNVKLFLLSEPTSKIKAVINGILTTDTHHVLDVDLIDHPQPVKVSKKENPYHITIKSPPRKAALSGKLLDDYKKGNSEASYISLDGDDIIYLTLKIFYDDRTYSDVGQIDPSDPLAAISHDNIQKTILEKEIRQIDDAILYLQSGDSDMETVDKIISDYNLIITVKKGLNIDQILYKKAKKAMYDLLVVKKNKNIQLKKISGNYSVENFPNYNLFQPEFKYKISDEYNKILIDIVNLGYSQFITNKTSSGKTYEEVDSSYNTLLRTCIQEITSIKIMDPINFYNWSKALFNWLNGLSKGTLVKIHNETSPNDSNEIVGYGFKTNSRLDEKIYKENKELRMYLPRGIYFDTNKQLKNFAIRKFFGEGIDEDKDEGEMTHIGEDISKHLFGSVPTHFFPTEKANGENSQVYVDNQFIFIGSKNRKIRLRRSHPIEDIDLYKRNYIDVANNTYFFAISFAENLIKKLINDEKYDMFLQFLEYTRWTANFEFENVNTQHVVYLSETRAVLIGFSSPFIDGVTCHPFLSVLVGIACNLDVVGKNGELQNISEMNNYISQMRKKVNSEGDVILELDENGNVLSLIKKKTIWYIILRATREKLRKSLKLLSENKLTLAQSLEQVKSDVTGRLTTLFNQDFLSDVSNQPEHIEEMKEFSSFIVNLFAESGISNHQYFMQKYPLFYNMFKGIEGSQEEYTSLIQTVSDNELGSYKKYKKLYMKYKIKYIKLKSKITNTL